MGLKFVFLRYFLSIFRHVYDILNTYRFKKRYFLPERIKMKLSAKRPYINKIERKYVDFTNYKLSLLSSILDWVTF